MRKCQYWMGAPQALEGWKGALTAKSLGSPEHSATEASFYPSVNCFQAGENPEHVGETGETALEVGTKM